MGERQGDCRRACEEKRLGEETVVWSGKPVVLAFYDGLLGGAMLIAASAVSLTLPGLVLLSIAGMACGFLLIAFAFFRAWANSYLVTDRRQEGSSTGSWP